MRKSNDKNLQIVDDTHDRETNTEKTNKYEEIQSLVFDFLHERRILQLLFSRQRKRPSFEIFNLSNIYLTVVSKVFFDKTNDDDTLLSQHFSNP